MAHESLTKLAQLGMSDIDQRLGWIESIQAAIERLSREIEGSPDDQIIDLSRVADHFARECRVSLENMGKEVNHA